MATSMTGYDMVVALTQNLINSQLAALTPDPNAPAPPPGAPAGDYPIESSFSVVLNPDAAPGSSQAWPMMQVNKMAAPTVEIISNGQVKLTLHILDGYIQYFNLSAQKGTASLDNVDVTFVVDMTLDTIVDPDSVNAPSATKEQLNGFTSDDFTIQFLALQFETATLMTTFDVSSPDFASGSPQYMTLMNCFTFYLGQLQGSDNPYILGYPIQSNEPAHTNPSLPEFAPTSCEFSTTPYINPPSEAYKGLSTLNYCLMTQHRAFPSTESRGVFDSVWVSDLSLAGAMVVSRNVFVSGYVEGYVLPQIKAALNIDTNWGQTSDPNYWNISAYISNEDQNDGKGEIIDSDGLNVYRLEKQWINCDVRLTTTGTIEINASGYFQVYIDEEQFMGLGMYQKLGEAEYKQPWTLKITLAIGTNGKFTLTTVVAEQDMQTIIEPNADFLESVGDWFANLFTGGDYTSVEEAMADKAQKTVQSMANAFNNSIAADMDVLANQFVLPAGDVFYYNSLKFNSAQDMQTNIEGYQ